MTLAFPFDPFDPDLLRHVSPIEWKNVMLEADERIRKLEQYASRLVQEWPSAAAGHATLPGHRVLRASAAVPPNTRQR